MARQAVKGKRDEGVDLARGLATVAMIAWHATDGWLAMSERHGAGYAVLAFLGTLPLASFLLLAGVGVALARDKGVSSKKIAKRGFEVLLLGYAVSALYLVFDWIGRGALSGSQAELFRSDVLHVIGLSIVTVVLLPKRAWIPIAIGATALSVLVNGRDVTHARFLVALFVDVDPITYLPLIPLVAWTGLGAALAQRRSYKMMLAFPIALGAYVAMHALHDHLGGTLDRGHPAIVFNVIDLGARALCVLGVGMFLAPRLRGLVKRALLLLGRGSLFAYAFHLPFCFGGLALFRKSLGLGAHFFAVAMLVAVTIAAVALRDRLRNQKPRSASADPSTSDAKNL